MEFVRNNWIWAIIVLTSVAFAAAGIAKLMGVPAVHASFAKLGMPLGSATSLGFAKSPARSVSIYAS